MTEKKKFVKGKIIIELLGHDNLTNIQKLIGLMVYMHSGNVQNIRLSNNFFMATFNIDNTTVARSMKALEREGYIQREMVKNTHNNRKHRIIHLLRND